ncbi:ITAX protein, partial [Polypterus senegalus]
MPGRSTRGTIPLLGHENRAGKLIPVGAHGSCQGVPGRLWNPEWQHFRHTEGIPVTPRVPPEDRHRAPGAYPELRRLYRCDTVELLQQHADNDNTLARRRARACGPTLARKCEQFVTYNGICYQLNQDLSQRVQFPDRLKGKKWTSGAGQEHVIGKERWAPLTQFAVAQYSSDFRTEMSFTQFDKMKSNNQWEWTIDGIKQIGSLTYTPTAIRKVVREVFISSAGSRLNANKVLIVITDGVTYGDDTPLSDVAREAQNKGVIRYAVGVGNAFNNFNANEELKTIASNPPDQYVFKVTDFNALDSIKDKLQDRIFAIEGTQASGESLQLEMAQEGFSALLLPDWTVVGAVGAYEWTGAFMKKISWSQSLSEQKFNIPKGSYLGYSVKAFRFQSTTYLALGAPRYSHKGAVSVTALDGTERLRILGNQVGSYFGAELCAVDFRNSGTSDLLLIGAPMHYENGREGQVTVCTLKKVNIKLSFDCGKALYGQSTEVHSRFGATLAEVQDFNGDSIKDVVIGAPMENNGQGSIYLYHGKPMGLMLQFSQRIEASQVSGGLQYFGQSVHGIMDISGDNIPDLVIGALGKVFVLRSRPIFEVRTNMKFSPDMIKVESGDCESKYTEHTLTLCFILTKKTKDNQAGQLSASINYTLSVDAKRTRPRAQFPNKRQHTNAVVSAANQNPCQNHSISIMTNGRMTIRCDSAPSKDEDLFRMSTCAINKPIFRSLAKVVFVATFDVDGNSEFGRGVSISATASRPEDSTKYVNFSLAREDMQRAVEHHYEVLQVEAAILKSTSGTLSQPSSINTLIIFAFLGALQVGNLGQRQVPVNLTVKVPVKLGQTNIWKDLDFVHTKQKKLSLQSSAALSFNEDLYIHLFTTGSNRYLQIQASTVIELYEEVNFIPIILGSCVGGLVLLALITAGLYKAGFFKRQYKAMMDEHEDPCDAPPDGAAAPTLIPTDGFNLETVPSRVFEEKAEWFGHQVLQACGPHYEYACGHNMYLSGVCYRMNADYESRAYQNITPGYQVVQFSGRPKLQFSFNDYAKLGNPESLVDRITQMYGGTKTPTAIKYVAENVFVPNMGSRSSASKILITITDGESQETYFTDAINAANAKNIIRYAIGVGEAFSKREAQQQLKTIASNDNNVFRVGDFSALNGIKAELQEKIFAIEAVGAYDWSGGFFEEGYKGLDFYNMTFQHSDMKESYMGYTMESATVGSLSYFIIGAPRYRHRGRVVVFQQHMKGHKYTIDGQQIGSSFGSVICSVDLTSKGQTDLLLVGAPLYYSPGREGQVFVYQFDSRTRQFVLTNSLKGVEGQPYSRFGASISQTTDLNGDGMNEVAVGAPLENDGRGSIYIFNGGSEGLRSYSQRIEAPKSMDGMTLFGHSLNGIMDLSGDQIPDLAVGSQGKVLILRSRPVLSVKTTITYKPDLIKTSSSDCQKEASHTMEVCFTVTKVTKDNVADVTASINYTLVLDAGRPRFRAFFTPGIRLNNGIFTTSPGRVCKNHKLIIPNCPEDSLNAITNEVSFTLNGEPSPSAENLRPIMDRNTITRLTAPLTFERNCGQDNECTDYLRLSFNFSGIKFISVGLSPVMNLTASIQNDNEDSYNTAVMLTYPSGLSYRRVTLLQAVFMATFDVDENSQFNRTVKIQANATSENQNHMGNERSYSMEIPVKFAINILVRNKVEESTKYINFSVGKEGVQRVVEHHYEVELPPGGPQRWNCSLALCKVLTCSLKNLQTRKPVTFKLRGNVTAEWITQTKQRKLNLHSSAELSFNEDQYIHLFTTGRNRYIQSQWVGPDVRVAAEWMGPALRVGGACTKQTERWAMGMSLVSSSKQLVGCGPHYEHLCGKNMYLNGVCYRFDRELQTTASRNITPGYQECTVRGIDIVFLIDGSGSVLGPDFQNMKVFMMQIINKFSGRNTNFAVVQFSSSTRVEFNFRQYLSSSSPNILINAIVQMSRGTNTVSGMRYVVDNIFAPSTGSRTDATKILITITDGESQEKKFEEVTRRADAKNIIRYAIGVGGAFAHQGPRNELNTIASSPNNVFRVDDFNALNGIQSQLEERIFSIEGTQKDTLASSFQLELSQGGFSLFANSIGSYFGAVICSVDLNKNGETDLLLISAPMYQSPGKGGQVFVYKFSSITRIEAAQLSGNLRLFGHSLHGILDLTGDQMPDLTIGSKGNVVVLRSRPVLGVEVTAAFQPEIINTKDEDCARESKHKMTLCFIVTKVTKDNAANLSATITYNLTLDSVRQRFRAHFTPGNRQMNSAFKAGVGRTCKEHNIIIPNCPDDFLIAITNELIFTMVGEPIPSASGLQPVLDMDSKTKLLFPLSFEKNCGPDQECIDFLQLSFNTTGIQETTRYINFSMGQDDITQAVEHVYEVENTGLREVSFTAVLKIPIRLQDKELWSSLATQQDCTIAVCKVLTCPFENLEIRKPVTLRMVGNMTSAWTGQVGFFKRQYQDLMNEANNSTDNMAAATENENFGQVQEERAA